MAEFTLNNGIILSPQVLKFYLFLGVLGLRCCMQAFSSYGELLTVRGLLTAVAFLVAQHRLWGFSGCSARA